jgi:uncharacterized repeat protein (TIGR01451 family)
MTYISKTVGFAKLNEIRDFGCRSVSGLTMFFSKFRLISFLLVGLFLPAFAQAQAFLDFTGPPTLVSGVDRTQGAQYRYANALPGIDVLVTLAQFNGALSPMVLLDDNTTFPTRFQPVITCAGNAGARECYIRFDFAFVVAGTFTPTPIYGLVASAQDTDGNGVANGVRESIEYTGATSVTLGTPTTLSPGAANIGGVRYIQNLSTDVQAGIGTGNQYESYAHYTAAPVTGISIAGGNVIGTAGCNSAAVECQRQNSYSFLPADSNVPSVTVRKISNGGVGTFSFTGTNGWVTQPVTTVTAGTAVTSQSEALLNVNVATTITESAPTGFALQSITCTGLGAGTATPTINGINGGNVVLSAAAAVSGNNIVCTFTNVRVPTLTVTKAATPNPLVVGAAGQSYAITIAVANGPTTAALTIADALPAGFTTSGAITATGGTLSGCPAAGATSLAGCSVALGAAGPIVITVPVNVNSAATPAVNNATVSGGGDPRCTGTAPACTGTVSTPVVSSAGLVISKTDGKSVTTSAGTNNYVVTLTNQGPSPAGGAILSDVVGAGLACPSANVVTCTVIGAGAVCPPGPLTIASLTAGVAVATLPPAGALQFAYTCNVN